jgi:hypothetical protein
MSPRLRRFLRGGIVGGALGLSGALIYQGIRGVLDWPLLLKWAIVAPSVLIAGVTVYLASVNLRAWWHERDQTYLAYALARLGLAAIVEQIGELILASPGVPPNIDSFRYLIGLLAVAIGYFGVAREHRRTRTKGV